MIIETNFLLFFAFILILGGLAIFTYSILKREKEFQQKENKTFQDYEQVLHNAQGEAKKLLDTTVESSAKILEDTQATNEHVEETLDTILQSMAQKHIRQLNEQAERLQKAYDENIKRIDAEFQQNTNQMVVMTQKGLHDSLDNFTKSLVGKTAESEALIDRRTQELLQQIEAEAVSYKKIRMKKIEGQIKELIQKTYTDVLHRSIPDSLHEEIIVESLERAKKDGMFNL